MTSTREKIVSYYLTIPSSDTDHDILKEKNKSMGDLKESHTHALFHGQAGMN